MSVQTVTRDASRVQSTAMNQQPQGQQSLVRVETSTPSLIRTPEELNVRLREWQKKYHVLSPVSQAMGEFDPQCALQWTLVAIDPFIDPSSKRGHDTYYNSAIMKGGKEDVNADGAERALNIIGLQKICKAAGIRWNPIYTRRVDDERRRYYWEFKAVGDYRSPDGEWLPLDASVSHDLRDGSAEIGYWTPEAWAAALAQVTYETAKGRFHDWTDKRVLQARVVGHRKAESKAKNAAVRSFGVAHTYTVKELREKPFLIIKAVFRPDMSNPEVARMVTAHGLGMMNALYPAARETLTLPAAVVRELDDDALDEDGHPTAGSAAPAAPAATAPVPLRVVDVNEKSGETNGRAWRVWVVSFSDGRKAATFAADTAGLAQQLRADKSEVEATIEPGKREGTFTLTELSRVKPAATEPVTNVNDLPDDAF